MLRTKIDNFEVGIDQNSHFSLHQNCFLIKGAVRGALYDLSSGNVYSINQLGVQLLERLELGQSIQESISGIQVDLAYVISYFRRLKELNLGDFIQGIEKPRVKSTLNIPLLRFAHIEMTEKCNHRCRHCYGGNDFAPAANRTEMSVEDYNRILVEIYGQGCRDIQFIGGEPFIRRKVLHRVASIAKQLGFHKIEIFTNATLVTETDLKWIKKYGISLAVSIHGSRSEIHDDITQTKGSWERSTMVVKKAISFKVPIRIAMIVMNSNESDVVRTIEFVRHDLGVEKIKTDYVRPSGRGCSSDLISPDLCDNQRLRHPSFSRITAESFWQSQKGHNCFNRKICISSYGDVFPCVMERNVKYGNALTSSIYDLLTSGLGLYFRTLTKDNVEGCRDCEYRYCCFDCRIKDTAFDSTNLLAKPWWCDYDPYLGKWLKKEGG